METRYCLMIALTGCLVLFCAGAGFGQKTTGGNMPSVDCSQCHTCETPTARDKCLRSCPSFTMTHITSAHSLAEAPDTLVLGELADQYLPVRFDHRAHAGMAEMGLQCATCHHYSPPGRIPPCRECHGGEANPNNLRQPALKGAYHRHCISCHREWSHDTKCVLCHLPADGLTGNVDTTDILGISHPIISEPDKRTYHTPYDKGPIVTFYHRQHIELYGLRCANCHQQENCSYCHNLSKPVRNQGGNEPKSMDEVHATCNGCHAKESCDKCHDTRERPAFSHALTGWTLNRFHEKLACRACHPTGKPIAVLDRRCDACHGGWSQDNFDHAVTGLRLDEVHIEADCGDCHTGRQFDRTPVCSECHDDERGFKDTPPGAYIGRP